MMGLTIYVLFRLALLKLRLDVFDLDFRHLASDNNTLLLARLRCAKNETVATKKVPSLVA